MAHTVQRRKMGQNSSQAGCPQLPTGTTIPLHRVGKYNAQEKLEGASMESILEWQTTHSREKVNWDTTYETALNLQVQVKSVVVAPSQRATSSKPMTLPLSEQNRTKHTRENPDESRVSQSDKDASTVRSQRVVIFNGDLDWEHEKRQYVHLVTRHMNENGADQDVMKELLNLMTHVADQKTGSDCRQWQHPSDLTRRNYQRGFGNSPAKITLKEWQAKNHKFYQRFAKLQKGFNEERGGKDVAKPGILDQIRGAHDTDTISLHPQSSKTPKQ